MKIDSYIEDSILIEKLAKLDQPFIKQAGLFESLNLSGVASSIHEFIKSHISADNPGGYIGSFLNIMAPSVVFKLNPFLGILYLIGTQYGFDVISVYEKIMHALKPMLESGKSVSAEEVNQIGKSIIGSEAGLSAEASPDDLFEPIRKQAGLLEDFISSGNQGQKLSIPWLKPDEKASVLQKIFGNLFSLPNKGKGKWLLGGFVIWIIKTALAGAGLLAGTEMIAKSLGHKKDVKQKHPTETKHTEKDVESLLKSGKDVWIVPLVNGSVLDTLIAWVKEIYHIVDSQVIEEVKKLPKFIEVLRRMSESTIIKDKFLVMPEQFNSRKQVIDYIIPEDFE